MKHLILATGIALLSTQALACSAPVINGGYVVCPRPQTTSIYAPKPLPTLPTVGEVVTTNRALRDLRRIVRRDKMVWGD